MIFGLSLVAYLWPADHIGKLPPTAPASLAQVAPNFIQVAKQEST